MSILNYEEMTLESDTFQAARETFNLMMQKLFRKMEQSDMDEGSIDLKISIELNEDFVPQEDGTTVRIKKPLIKHKISTVVPVKDSADGKRDEDKTLHRQLKGINAVKFMLAHVDRMLEVYQRECETSSNEIIQRRWKVIQMMYLDREKKKSTKEIAEFYNMELSTIQKDAKEARNDLTVLFFGLDAMILHDFGNPMDK